MCFFFQITFSQIRNSKKLSVKLFQYKFQFQIGTEDELRKLSEDLTTNDIKHKLWIEQPENIATCIALKPYEKDAVKKFTRKYKMLK